MTDGGGAQRAVATLSSIAESCADGIFTLDRDGRLLTWNHSAERIFGYAASEVVGRSAEFLFPDHLGNRPYLVLERVLAGERLERLESEGRRADGMGVSVSLNVAPISDCHGGILGASVVAREMTEQKLAQETLAESEARLQEAQSLAHVGIWLWDLATGTVQWSEELHRIHAVDPLTFEGTYEAHLARVAPEDRDRLRQAMADATGGGDELAEEYRVVRPTSEVRWVFARGQATRDTAGTIVGLRGICQDITERKRGEEALRHHANLLQILQGIAMAANEAATLEAALAFCLSDICRHTGFSVARVTFVDPLGEPATGGFHHTEDPELAAVLDFPATHLLPGSEALVAAVLAERAPVWVVDLAAGVPSRDCRIRAGFAFPVSVGAEVAAVLEFFAREPADPDQQLMEAMTAAGVQLGRVLERTRAEESLSYRALHDPLTGLPNRALFLDRLNHALVRRDRLTRKTAVLFLDLDGFKDVNDSLGHEAGDALLVVLAGRLQGILRPSDTVARFGGDEFTILCEGLVEEDVALEIAARVADVVAVPVTLGGVQEVVISTSVGIAFARSPADTAEGLLRDADMAMYRAKELGRARYAIFDVTLHARAARRLETVTALRRAVELHQLGLFYQPVVSLPDGRMVGTEALIRWRHPERGLLGPGEFISLAEESQLIVPIGNWVLEEACRQAVEWQKANAGARPLELSVNVSARQLTYGGLVEAIDLALSTSGIDPHLLCLEITESVLMADADFYLEAMLGLKCLDVRLAVDDFGMGYSSLAYLKRFPIDVLKIDKAFVDGLGRDDSRSAAIVGAILDLAAALELTAVAEGVETLEQASDLEAMGCPRAQGYYFARPEPPEALARLIGGAPLPAAARPG